MTDRDAFVQKMKARIDEWNAEIDKLEAQARGAQADQKAKYDEELKKMRDQRDTAQAKMEEAKKAGDAAWDDMQDGMRKAWDSLSGAFEQARARFR